MTFPFSLGWLECLMMDPSANLAITNRRILHVIEGENTPYGNLLWFATNTGVPFEPRAVPPTQRLCIADQGLIYHMLRDHPFINSPSAAPGETYFPPYGERGEIGCILSVKRAFIDISIIPGTYLSTALPLPPLFTKASEIVDTFTHPQVLRVSFCEEHIDQARRIPQQVRMAIPAPLRYPPVDGSLPYIPPQMLEGHFADILVWVSLSPNTLSFLQAVVRLQNGSQCESVTVLSADDVRSFCHKVNWTYIPQPSRSMEIIMTEQTQQPEATYPIGMVSRTRTAESSGVIHDNALSGAASPLGLTAPVEQVGLHCLVDSASLVAAFQSAVATKMATIADSTKGKDPHMPGDLATEVSRRAFNPNILLVAGMDGLRIGFISNLAATGSGADTLMRTTKNAPDDAWFSTTAVSWKALPAGSEEKEGFGFPLPFRPWAASISVIPDLGRSGVLGVFSDMMAVTGVSNEVTIWQNMAAVAEMMDVGFIASLPYFPVCLVSFYQEVFPLAESSSSRRGRGDTPPNTIYTKVIFTFLTSADALSKTVSESERGVNGSPGDNPLSSPSLKRVVFETSAAPSLTATTRNGAGVVLPYFSSQATSRCYLGDCFGALPGEDPLCSTHDALGRVPAWLVYSWMLMGNTPAGICRWPASYESWDHARVANNNLMNAAELRASVETINTDTLLRVLSLSGRKSLEGTSVSIWWENLKAGGVDLVVELGGWKTSLHPQEEHPSGVQGYGEGQFAYRTFPDDISVKVQGFKICRVVNESSPDRGVRSLLQHFGKGSMSMDLYSPPLQRVTGISGSRTYREGNGMGMVVLRERGPSLAPLEVILPAVPLVGMVPVDKGCGLTHKNLQDPDSITRTILASSVLSVDEVSNHLSVFEETPITHQWKDLPCSLEGLDRCNREKDFMMISRNGYCRFVSGNQVSDRVDSTVEFSLRNMVSELAGLDGEDRLMTGILIPISLFRETIEVLRVMGSNSRCRIWLQKVRRDRLAGRQDALQEGLHLSMFQGIDLGVGRFDEETAKDWRSGDYDLSFRVVVAPPGDLSLLSSGHIGVKRGVLTKYFPALRLLASTDSLVPCRQ